MERTKRVNVIEMIVGPLLDLAGSEAVEESCIDSVVLYGRYDRETNERIGEERVIVRDGIAWIVQFYSDSSLRKSVFRKT